MSIVGENVKRLRVEKGISQNRLAKLAGISQSALSSIESSTKAPSIDSVLLLAQALHCSVAELMGESYEYRPPTDAELKFALFDGDQNITDAQFEEVKRFAQFIRERDRRDK